MHSYFIKYTYISKFGSSHGFSGIIGFENKITSPYDYQYVIDEIEATLKRGGKDDSRFESLDQLSYLGEEGVEESAHVSAGIFCENCGEIMADPNPSVEEEKIEYSHNGEIVTLTAFVPVYSCIRCDFQWTDYLAEDIRERVVDAYIKENEKLA